LCATSDPSGRRPTTSVKVPPRSIQKSQSCGEVFLAIGIEFKKGNTTMSGLSGVKQAC
jgi:hypothetical protein